MKKRIVLIMLLFVGLLMGCTNNGNDIMTEINEPVAKSKLEVAVIDAIFNNNANAYLEGECTAEGHIILSTKESKNEAIVYALTMYGNYGFENGNFVKKSGSGTIPTVFKFDINEDNYVLKEIKYPVDGSGYVKSIKEMFPEELHNKVLIIDEKDSIELSNQEKQYAKDYLNKIGREAEIGEYGDFEHTFFSDKGISGEIVDKILKDKYMYPMYIGDCEAIENGVRYVYASEYDEDEKEITFEKYIYDTREVVERVMYDSTTGQEKK